MPETFANSAVGYLNAAMASGDTSLTLQSGQGATFPSGPQFRILIDQEIIIVGAISGDTLSSLTRAAEGTAAVAHSINAQVTQILTAAALNTFVQTIGIGTSLPASPYDGQEYILVDSTTAPTYAWRFRYTASITDAYKWVCVYGSPLYNEVTTLETSNSATYAALTTAGPSVTPPRAGIYVVEHGFTANTNVADAHNIGATMSYDIGATGAVDADSCSGVPDVPGAGGPNQVSCMRRREKTLTSASTALVAKYRQASTSGQTGRFSQRWISVTPVRVS